VGPFTRGSIILLFDISCAGGFRVENCRLACFKQVVAVVCTFCVGGITSELGYIGGGARDTASSNFKPVMRCRARLRRGHYLRG